MYCPFLANLYHATTENSYPAMNIFVLVAAHCVFLNLLVKVVGKFYIQFRVDRPKTLIRRVIGNDYWDQPQWRIYSCFEHKATHNDSAAVHCTRFKPGWPKKIRFQEFYVDRKFFITYRPLNASSVPYTFSDVLVDQLPAEIWVGCEHARDLPYFTKTKEMLQFFRKKTEGWLDIVEDQSRQKNLIEYLAAPDMSWAYGDPNVTTAYIQAYVTYMDKVMKYYDSYMLDKDVNFEIPDAPLDWRGPAWLDWKLLKPIKKSYNVIKMQFDQMHGLWLKNPALEEILRRMIPVLTSKAMDPCFLQGVPNHTYAESFGIHSGQYVGMPQDFLCTIYCRFSYVVSRLYLTSVSSRICALTGAGGPQNGGQCEEDRCICLKKGAGVRFQSTIAFSACMNVFNLERYNETHSCNPDPT